MNDELPRFLPERFAAPQFRGGTDVKSISRRILPVLVVAVLSCLCQTVHADTDDQQGAQTGRSSAPLRAQNDISIDKRPVVIWSDGTRMVGDVYKPKALSKEEKLPAIIFCNGTGGTKDGTAARLAPMIVQNGFIFLAF